MDFLKKWASCIVSFVAGFLGLILSLCTGMKSSYSVVSSTELVPINVTNSETTKAHKMLTDSKLADQAELYDVKTEFNWLKTFSIIMTVVSILLIVYAIVILLKNLNVIKVEHAAFDISGIVLAALLFIAVVGLIITSNVYANAMQSAVADALKLGYASYLSYLTISVSVSVGVYQWTMLIVGIIAAIASTTFIILKRKDS